MTDDRHTTAIQNLLLVATGCLGAFMEKLTAEAEIAGYEAKALREQAKEEESKREPKSPYDFHETRKREQGLCIDLTDKKAAT